MSRLLSIVFALFIVLVMHVSPILPSVLTAPTSAKAQEATNAEVLNDLGVNELGVIPILMYHAFTTDASIDDLWTRHIDDFRHDLEWLHDHNFYVISVRDLIDNTIDVPLGKHPVILTFDDASAMQFLFAENTEGEFVPDPNSAVGILDEFFATHPDFGKSGHFAIVPSNCFAWEGDPLNSLETCPAKLQYLVDNGYEVGNHTWGHANLAIASSDAILQEIGEAALFIDQHVTGRGNLSRVLTLPFGEPIAPGSAGESAVQDGFSWNGELIHIEAMIQVSGGPVYSPSSTWWNPTYISRFNTDPDSIAYWFGAIERGDLHLYTSDGDPGTITIPIPLPEYLQNELEPEFINASGKTLIEYPASSEVFAIGNGVPPAVTSPAFAVGDSVEIIENEVRLRGNSSTTASILSVLDQGDVVIIVGGPSEDDSHTWWQVETKDGLTGWVAADYLGHTDQIS